MSKYTIRASDLTPKGPVKDLLEEFGTEDTWLEEQINKGFQVMGYPIGERDDSEEEETAPETSPVSERVAQLRERFARLKK